MNTGVRADSGGEPNFVSPSQPGARHAILIDKSRGGQMVDMNYSVSAATQPLPDTFDFDFNKKALHQNCTDPGVHAAWR